MIINPKIKEVLKEIEKESIKYHNVPINDRKYNKRILKLFKEHLTEEEQVYMVSLIFEYIHYKNIITDPDTILAIQATKLRSFTYVFILALFLLLTAAILFKTNDSLNGIITIITNGFKFFSI